jgi:hypothetical protein
LIVRRALLFCRIFALAGVDSLAPEGLAFL